MNDNIKVVLAHPDKQHSFKTAKALIDAGVLEKYITTVYDKPRSLTHFFTKFVGGHFKKKLQAHRTTEIDDSKVKLYTEFLSLMLLLLVRIDKSKKIYSRVRIYRDKLFNKKVACYCKRNKIDAIVSFDVVSAQLYEYLGDLNVIKILDMSAPQFSYMFSLFENETKKYFTSSLTSTLHSPLFRYWKRQSEYEIKSADIFLVASDFTKKSLVLSGADESKVFKCMYGLNHEFFNLEGRSEKTSMTLRCVYVGNVTEQKGSRYLFEAIKRTKAESLDIDFIVVGAYNIEEVLISEVKNLCKFTGHILPTELKKILQESDIIIFPSLADGFGFAVLEAMACGVVPICSKNAGISDVIKNKNNGFLIDAMNSNAIYEILKDLVCHQDRLEALSYSAALTTKAFIWEKYYLDVQKVIDVAFREKR